MRSCGLKLNCKHSTQATVKSYKAEGFRHCLREGLMVEMSALQLFTVANLHCQLS